MDFKRSLKFAFNDPHAVKKLLTGGLFVLAFFTVYFFFVVVGYVMRILSAALEGRDAKLPEWDSYKDLFNEGLLPILVMLAFAAPFIGIAILEIALFMVVAPSAEIIAIFNIVRGIVFVVTSFLLPLALIRYVISGTAREALNFTQLVDFVRTNPKNYISAWAVSLGTGFVATVIGSLALGIGLCFTLFFNSVVVVHLFAQAYRASTPFKDDKDGAIRSSYTLPPPLKTNTG